MSDENNNKDPDSKQAAPASGLRGPNKDGQTVPPTPDLEEEPLPPEPNPPPPSPRAPLGDISLDASLTKEASKMKPTKPKKNVNQIMYGALGIFLLIVVMMVYSCQPREGSMAFGICSTYLELNTPYPYTLKYTDLEGSRTAVRIYFTGVDPFGEFKQEMLECTFGPDETMGMKLVEIKRNRRPIDAEEVKKFNKLLPTIMASDPYRIMPPAWKNPLLEEDAPMYETHPVPKFKK